MQYRSDIDGLRAIAVLAVVVHHAGFGVLAGGFVGVDIFFVISGYLIGNILFKEVGSGTFSAMDFFSRRVKRLYPMLFLIIMLVYVFVFVFGDPVFLKDVSGWGLFSLFYIPNVYAFLTVGYFSESAHLKPLIHLWSLGVEEQFYIIFTIFMVLAAGRRFRLLLVLLIFGSLGVSVWMSLLYVDAAYYLVVSRAWELMVGAYCAIYAPKLALRSREVVAFASLLVLIISMFLVHDYMPFPGYTAIPVILCSALLLTYAPGTMVAKLISVKPLVLVGVSSYSVYLLHQPLFALIRKYSDLEVSSSGVGVFLILLLLVTSYFSYLYIETPFRKSSLSGKKLVLVYLLSLLGASALFAFSYFQSGLPWRFFDIPSAPDKKMLISPYRSTCHTEGVNYLNPVDACVLGDGSHAKWVVVGDSHGVELAYTLSKRVGSVKQLTFSACSFNSNAPGCASWLVDVEEYLLGAEEVPLNILVVFRYSLYVSNMPDDYYFKLNEFVQKLVTKGHRVTLVGEIPGLKRDVAQLYFPFGIWKSGEDRAPASDQLEPSLVNICSGINVEDSLFYCFEPSEILRAAYTVDSTVRFNFFDNNHLSIQGADILLDSVLEHQ